MSAEIKIKQITELLGTGTGRGHIDMISGMVRKNPEMFMHLAQVVLHNTEPESRKAAWVIDTMTEEYPEMIQEDILVQFIDLLPAACHTALHRHILRMLDRSLIPPAKTGELLTLCFDYLTSPDEPVAVKVHAMNIIHTMARSEPGLLVELTGILELRREMEPPGFRNRAVKILQSIYSKNPGTC